MNYKEFLNVKDGYKLVMLPEHAGDDEKSGLIEVPDGAEFLTECFDDGELFRLWWKEEYKICIGYDEDWFNVHRDVDDYLSDVDGSILLWQRSTQPEELPFIDDEVNHPPHYTTHPSGIECITITRHHDFAIGNAIKYLWRAGLKDSDNEIQDLEKAIWYINDKIEQLKNAK